MSPSAGGQASRSIRVYINTSRAGGQVVLFTRTGRAGVWNHERRLGHAYIDSATIAATETVAGILRAAGDSLYEAARRLDGGS